MPYSAQAWRDAACALIIEALRDDHVVTMRAQGTSMLPAIWPGDRLTIRPAGAARPAVGEIALTIWPGGLRAHRVIARSEQGVITRGDALETADPLIANAAILGTVALCNGVPLGNRTALRRGVFGKIV